MSVIEGEAPLPEFEARAGAEAAAIDGHAAEKIIIAKGMVVIGKQGRVQGLVFQQLHAGGKASKVIEFIAGGGGTAGAEGIPAPTECALRVERIAQEIG